MLLPINATVAVADGETLALYRNSGHEGAVALTALPAPQLAETSAGSGGRHYSSAGNPDVHHQAEDDFAAGAAAWLNRQVLDGKVEALMVIAPPKTLGELRKHYHKALQAVLVGELAKEMVGRSVEDIAAAVAHA
ncbi:host attachment protein [uncultured Phenylobacterium sp.]|uniref:host attachment family protein n=1 Tax=uncultured Phenylobacterium sp. TaxID=349273 RepID=UPI0025F915D7|nr:host attachment protein [uncultured Phenylobacterium sp.]